MTSVRQLRPPPPSEPPTLHARAMDNLAFIRNTMEAAGSFTAVSGGGMVAVGVLATLVAVIAERQATAGGGARVWVPAPGLLPFVILRPSRHKARPAKQPPGFRPSP